jgi:hypothetical protein
MAQYKYKALVATQKIFEGYQKINFKCIKYPTLLLKI